MRNKVFTFSDQQNTKQSVQPQNQARVTEKINSSSIKNGENVWTDISVSKNYFFIDDPY